MPRRSRRGNMVGPDAHIPDMAENGASKDVPQLGFGPSQRSAEPAFRDESRFAELHQRPMNPARDVRHELVLGTIEVPARDDGHKARNLPSPMTCHRSDQV